MEAGGITLVVPGHSYQTAQDIFKIIRKEVELTAPCHHTLLPQQALSVSCATTAVPSGSATNTTTTTTASGATPTSGGGGSVVNITNTLTAQDIERDRGRQLTKYERNMMIFNWLQTLEETTYDMMT